jgi:hypothetical protein
MAIILAPIAYSYQPAFLWTDFRSTASVTPTDSYSGFDPDDILIGTEDTYHRFADNSGPKDYVIDLGVATLVNYVAILGKEIDQVLCTVAVSTDNFVASDVELYAETPLSAVLNAAWAEIAEGVYRYIKISLDSFSVDMRIAHVCLGVLQRLPFLEEDSDPDSYQTEGEHAFSAQGIYIGSTQSNAMRELPINFGQVPDYDYAQIADFADACIKTMRGCFFVPDATANACFFGVVKENAFRAPLKNGLRQVEPFTFLTKAL